MKQLLLCVFLALCLLLCGCAIPDFDTMTMRSARDPFVFREPETEFLRMRERCPYNPSVPGSFPANDLLIVRGTVIDRGSFIKPMEFHPEQGVFYEVEVKEVLHSPPDWRRKNIVSVYHSTPYDSTLAPMVGQQYIFLLELYSDAYFEKNSDPEFLAEYFDCTLLADKGMVFPVTSEGVYVPNHVSSGLLSHLSTGTFAPLTDERAALGFMDGDSQVERHSLYSTWHIYPMEAITEGFLPYVRERLEP